MKSQIQNFSQSIMGEAENSFITGFIMLYRPGTSNHLYYRYGTGTTNINGPFNDFFQNLDNQ